MLLVFFLLLCFVCCVQLNRVLQETLLHLRALPKDDELSCEAKPTSSLEKMKDSSKTTKLFKKITQILPAAEIQQHIG